jgi:enediyne biosynthesis protein E5
MAHGSIGLAGFRERSTMNTKVDLRLPALRRFAAAITILNIVGRTVLGFEGSWAQMFAALGTAYTMEFAFDALDARISGRKPEFMRGGWRGLIDFLLSAHITAMACSMLLYANERVFPIVFATAAALGSKAIFRVRVGAGERHFLNPSNTGIAITLLLFPWVGTAQPYQFTENVTGAWDWIIPGIIVCTGSFLNGKLTKKLPLIGAWLGTFVLQAVLRSLLTGTPLAAGLMPMTGMAFLLFTFYMVTDPATTPVVPSRQAMFGASVALVYGLLQVLHIAFGLFFSLLLVCTVRGLALYVAGLRRAPAAAAAPLPSLIPVSPSPSVDGAER